MGVTIKRVCCQSCGADLDIPEGVRFLSCNYCHSKLEVVQDQSTTHTRLLEKVAMDTGKMAANLRVLELQNDLERLDREWDDLKEHYTSYDQHGRKSMPSKASSIVGGFFGIGGGILWMRVTASSSAPAFVPWIGLVFIGIGIFSLVHGTTRAGRYGQDRDRYEHNRSNLIARIDAARGKDRPL